MVQRSFTCCQNTSSSCGYATLHDITTKTKEDRMESFFLSETCKYLYLVRPGRTPNILTGDYISHCFVNINSLFSQDNYEVVRMRVSDFPRFGIFLFSLLFEFCNRSTVFPHVYIQSNVRTLYNRLYRRSTEEKGFVLPKATPHHCQCSIDHIQSSSSPCITPAGNQNQTCGYTYVFVHFGSYTSCNPLVPTDKCTAR